MGQKKSLDILLSQQIKEYKIITKTRVLSGCINLGGKEWIKTITNFIVRFSTGKYMLNKPVGSPS